MDEMTPGPEPEDNLERLLAQPGQEDERVAALLRAARRRLSAPAPDDVRDRHLSAIHGLARQRAERRSLSWADRARAVIGMTSVKVGLAAAAAAAATGGAVTGTLPPPVQEAVAEVGEAVGIELPRPGGGDAPAAPGRGQPPEEADGGARDRDGREGPAGRGEPGPPEDRERPDPGAPGREGDPADPEPRGSAPGDPPESRGDGLGQRGEAPAEAPRPGIAPHREEPGRASPDPDDGGDGSPGQPAVDAPPDEWPAP